MPHTRDQEKRTAVSNACTARLSGRQYRPPREMISTVFPRATLNCIS